jgi:endoglucanase
MRPLTRLRFGVALWAILVGAALLAGARAPAAAMAGVTPAGASAVPGPRDVAPGDCRFRRRPVTGDRRARSSAAPNPLAGERWYVDRRADRFGFREPAYGDYVRSARAGRTGIAAELAKIALTPRFKWFGKFSKDPKRRICAFIADAEAEGAVPLVATLRHQGKQCNPRYKAGGVREDRATKRWYRHLAEGIGSSRVVIAFEPDSVGTVECLARSRRKARLRVLRYGVDVLSRLPNATIYIEATASDWKRPKTVVRRLRYIGIHKVRGFMLNVTHYDWTTSNIRYGRRISRKVGHKPFVISTAMNGRGPVHYRRRVGRKRYRRVNVFCHPLYRGAGPFPTTTTADPKVDAYLWINRAGYSGGSCNGGPTPVGRWWRERALMLARYQSQQLGPPRSNSYGFGDRRLTIRQVAGDQYKR